VLGCGYASLAIGLSIVGAQRQRELEHALRTGGHVPLRFRTVALFTVGGVALAAMTVVLVIAQTRRLSQSCPVKTLFRSRRDDPLVSVRRHARIGEDRDRRRGEQRRCEPRACVPSGCHRTVNLTDAGA
jgi:hypothetical protein